MKKIKLHERMRLIIQCISFCFHNGYVRGWFSGSISSGINKTYCVPGLNCYSCPGAVGACPIGSLQAVLDSGQFHVSLYVFGFIAALGVFCGRFICGWLCPFGLIQDLLHRIPIFKKAKNMPGHNKLRWLRYVILVVFVLLLPALVMGPSGTGEPWFCEWICPSGTLLGGIPLLIANPALRSTIGFRFAWKFVLLLIVIGLSIKFDRPFCKYVCPLGALYGLANPISIYRLKCNEEDCIKCGACQKVCGMDIKVWEKPNSVDCIRCGKCLAACPTGALSSTFSFRKTTGENPGKVPAGTVKEQQTVNQMVDQTVENVAQQTAEQDTLKNVQQEANPASKPKKGSPLYIILGLVCFVAGIISLWAALGIPVLFALSQPTNDFKLQLFLYAPSLFALVPVTMVFIMGFYLIGTHKHPEYIEQLQSWPFRVLIVVLVTFLVGSACNFISSMLGGDGISPDVFVSALVTVMKNFGSAYIATAIASLAAMIPLHGSKNKSKKRR